jgi:signal transduction histidine kinase
VHQQRLYTASRQEQAKQRAREQLAEARRARSEERLQIARELHDVVAHSMSLIAVQAGVANYVVGQHPEEAARALSSIEETSRGALREMRAMLGVLRTEETGLDPAPGLADLGRLAERAGEAASASTSTSAASRPGFLLGWTWPPTGSSRRRSPT